MQTFWNLQNALQQNILCVHLLILPVGVQCHLIVFYAIRLLAPRWPWEGHEGVVYLFGLGCPKANPGDGSHREQDGLNLRMCGVFPANFKGELYSYFRDENTRMSIRANCKPSSRGLPGEALEHVLN